MSDEGETGRVTLGQRALQLFIFMVIGLAILLVLSLLDLVGTWYARWHVIAALAIFVGAVMLALIIAERLAKSVGLRTSDRDLRDGYNAVEFFSGLVVLGFACLLGLAAALWPSGFMTSDTPTVFGAIALLLALFSLQSLIGAPFGALLVWIHDAAGPYGPWLKFAGALLMLVLVLYGFYMAVIDSPIHR